MHAPNHIGDDGGAAGTRMSASTVFWLSLACIATIDVITKYIAHTRMVPANFPRPIAGDVLRFTLIYNPGAAFGLNVGPYSRWIFLALTVAALVVLGNLYRSTSPADWRRALAIGLVSGGAVGNLFNRLWSTRGVVDFIDMGIGSHRWPAFNVADIGITIGAFLLAWVLWREERTGPAEFHE